MDTMLLSVSCSLFSAVAVCMLKWWMVNLLRNKEELFDFKHRLLSSANDQRIHGNYRVKTHSGKCSVWYIKTKWKLLKIQYQFADAQRNWLMGRHNSSAFIPFCTFDILYRKKTANIFFLMVLYTLLFAAQLCIMYCFYVL